MGLHETANAKATDLRFWIVQSCIKRYPGVIDELNRHNASVSRIVSFSGLASAMIELIRTDVFLSTVESTTARHKLPYLLTKLANAVGLSTFTMQHGFENVGLTYRDEVHGAEVKFVAQTVLTWGPTKELPDWVGADTREKCVAVGCPKKIIIQKNEPQIKPGERPVIGVFDNLHWHRYGKSYVSKFLDHLEETASNRKDVRFVLKSHPESIRNRSKEFTARLCSIENLEVADLLEANLFAPTTLWLLQHALGIITTPSTIALDGALAGVPIAVTRYDLNLDYYSPLKLLDNLEDWYSFLDDLTESQAHKRLKLNGELFLKRVIVPGNPAEKIFDMMTRH